MCSSISSLLPLPIQNVASHKCNDYNYYIKELSIPLSGASHSMHWPLICLVLPLPLFFICCVLVSSYRYFLVLTPNMLYSDTLIFLELTPNMLYSDTLIFLRLTPNILYSDTLIFLVLMHHMFLHISCTNYSYFAFWSLHFSHYLLITCFGWFPIFCAVIAIGTLCSHPIIPYK